MVPAWRGCFPGTAPGCRSRPGAPASRPVLRVPGLSVLAPVSPALREGSILLDELVAGRLGFLIILAVVWSLIWKGLAL
jgi:hypothetical protein